MVRFFCLGHTVTVKMECQQHVHSISEGCLKSLYSSYFQFNRNTVSAQDKTPEHLTFVLTLRKISFFFFPSRGHLTTALPPVLHPACAAGLLCSSCRRVRRFQQLRSSDSGLHVHFRLNFHKGNLVNRESMAWAQISIWIPQFNVLFNSSFLRNNSRLLSIVSKANVFGSLT